MENESNVPGIPLAMSAEHVSDLKALQQIALDESNELGNSPSSLQIGHKKPPGEMTSPGRLA